MAAFEFKKLDWDSDFFLLNISKIVNGNFNDTKKNLEIEQYIIKEKVDLLYLESEFILQNFLENSKIAESYLVDTKITYKKKIFNQDIDDGNILNLGKFKIKKHRDVIINLAIQSGVYSRFNLDEKFNKNDFKLLYKEWILNSINKNIADEVLFYEVDDEVVSLVTLGIKNNIGDIGIIAVDQKYRGQGIAKKMMYAAENWFFKRGINFMQVVTQNSNIPAKMLYEKCGYKIADTKYFYHIYKINK